MKKLVIIAILLCIAAISTKAQRIFGAEYFIDGPDPGFGKGIALSGSFPADSLSVSASININVVSPGVHILYIRTYDSLGLWSHYVPVLFSVELGINSKISAAEAFFDANDPGINKGFKLNGSFPSDSLVIKDSISVSNFSPGVHQINFRAIDVKNIASVNEKRLFSVFSNPASPIVYAEYFVDSDPGIGKATVINIPQNLTSLKAKTIFNVPASFSGKHYVYVRVKDKEGIWSIYEKKEFDICSNYSAEAYFDADVNGNAVYFNNESKYADSFMWDFGNGIKRAHSTMYESMYYDSAWEYNVCLTASNVCGTSKLCKKISISGIQSQNPTRTTNNGFYLLTVRGVGFPKDAKVTIYNSSYHYDARDVYIINDNLLRARFSFNNIPGGFYNVMVYDSSKSITTAKKNQGIWVEDSIKIDEGNISKQLIFPQVIRPGNYYNAYLSITNNSPLYAVGVPVTIKTSGHLSSVLVTSISDSGLIDSAFSKQLPWNRFYKYYNDSINPTDSHNISMIVIPFLEPMENILIHFLIKTDIWGPFKLQANVMSPLYKESGLDSIDFRSKCNWLPPCMRCMLDIGGFAPGIGCFTNAFDLGCVIGSSPKNRTAADLFGALGGAILGCIPGKPVIGALADAAKIADLVNNFDDIDKKNKDCRQCFPNPPDDGDGVGQGSMDPNIKYGPHGFEKDNFINGDISMNYIINFENSDTATAPAAQVVIIDKIDTSKFDKSTIKFLSFGFNNSNYLIDTPADSFTYDIDLRPVKNTILRVLGYFEDSTSLLYVKFLSLNPYSMSVTEVLSDGFLNPNLKNREGEGFIMFSIMPKANLPHLSEIKNSATLVFDYNQPINTPVWINNVDRQKPVSSVKSLSPVTGDTSFYIHWSGSDYHSGIAGYDIYYSENGGPYTQLYTSATSDSLLFNGKNGNSYAFYSLSFDKVQNQELSKSTADAQTQIIVGVNESIDSLYNNLFLIYPNPADDKTTIWYHLKNNSQIKLELFNIVGQTSSVILNTKQNKGDHLFEINLKEFEEGIYFLKFTTEDFNITNKLIVN